jgi:hypothetical protein
LDRTVTIEIENRRLDQPVNAGSQGAQIVGELLGKHRQNGAREVNTGPALPRLRIERGPRADEVGHVGNVNEKAKSTAGTFFDGDGIVEILGGFTVDGHGWRCVEPLAPGKFRAGNARRKLAGRLEHVVGKLQRQAVLLGHDDNVDARIVEMPDGLQDLSFSGSARAAHAQELDRDNISIVSSAAKCRGDVDRIRERWVERIDHSGAACRAEHSDQSPRARRESLDDGTLKPSSAAAPAQPHRHSIPRQSGAERARRNEDVFASAVKDDEPVTIGVPL